LGGIKEDWGSGDRRPPAGSRGGKESGGALFVKLHIIFVCIKIQQTTGVGVTG